MKTLTLTIGHNVRGVRTHDAAGVCAAVSRVLGVDAYTAVPCAGMWRGEAEESTRFEIAALEEAEAARLMALVPALAAALGQAEIMAETRDCAAVFVAASAGEMAETA